MTIFRSFFLGFPLRPIADEFKKPNIDFSDYIKTDGSLVFVKFVSGEISMHLGPRDFAAFKVPTTSQIVIGIEVKFIPMLYNWGILQIFGKRPPSVKV
jgi:hypothetical protein